MTYIDAYHESEKGQNPHIQIAIIRQLIRHDKQNHDGITSFDLSCRSTEKTNLGFDYSDIVKAVKRLHDNKLVESWCDFCKHVISENNEWKTHEKSSEHKANRSKNSKKRRGRGQAKRLLQLTLEGFKMAIDDPLKTKKEYVGTKIIGKGFEREEIKIIWEPITNEQFWNYLINELGNATQEEIIKLDTLYLSKILHVDLNYLIPIMFDRRTKDVEYDEWCHFEKISYSIRGLHPDIAFTIAESENRMTKIELLKKINNVKIRYQTRPENIEHYIDDTILNGYLQHIDGKLELTHSGLLEYLFLFYKKYFITHENLKKNFKYTNLSENKNTLSKLEKIRTKYSFLLPDILNNSNFEKLGISLYDVVKLLLRIYKNLGKEELESIYDDRDDFQVEEYHSIERYLQTRKEAYYRKLTKHVQIDALKNSNIEELNNAEKWYFHLHLLVDNYEILRDKDVLPELRNIVLDPKDNYYKQFNARIMNLITFEFYSYYKMYVDGWNNNLQQSEIRKWHDNEIKTLLVYSHGHIDEIAKLNGLELNITNIEKQQKLIPV